MSCVDNKVAVQLNTTNATCPIGETTGKKNIMDTLDNPSTETAPLRIEPSNHCTGCNG